jgi:hypothetical protein
MPAATRSLPTADRYIAAERNAGTVRVGRVSKEFSGEASVADTVSEYSTCRWKVLRTARRNGALAWLSITRSMESLSGRFLSKTRPRNHKPIPTTIGRQFIRQSSQETFRTFSSSGVVSPLSACQEKSQSRAKGLLLASRVIS